jgi:hypothetical protein
MLLIKLCGEKSPQIREYTQNVDSFAYSETLAQRLLFTIV